MVKHANLFIIFRLVSCDIFDNNSLILKMVGLKTILWKFLGDTFWFLLLRYQIITVNSNWQDDHFCIQMIIRMAGGEMWSIVGLQCQLIWCTIKQQICRLKWFPNLSKKCYHWHYSKFLLTLNLVHLDNFSEFCLLWMPNGAIMFLMFRV